MTGTAKVLALLVIAALMLAPLTAVSASDYTKTIDYTEIIFDGDEYYEYLWTISLPQTYNFTVNWNGTVPIYKIYLLSDTVTNNYTFTYKYVNATAFSIKSVLETPTEVLGDINDFTTFHNTTEGTSTYLTEEYDANYPGIVRKVYVIFQTEPQDGVLTYTVGTTSLSFSSTWTLMLIFPTLITIAVLNMVLKKLGRVGR